MMCHLHFVEFRVQCGIELKLSKLALFVFEVLSVSQRDTLQNKSTRFVGCIALGKVFWATRDQRFTIEEHSVSFKDQIIGEELASVPALGGMAGCWLNTDAVGGPSCNDLTARESDRVRNELFQATGHIQMCDLPLQHSRILRGGEKANGNAGCDDSLLVSGSRKSATYLWLFCCCVYVRFACSFSSCFVGVQRKRSRNLAVGRGGKRHA
mmetsp:Transcript_12226/g.30986  ORF Transcript_12226/g.30986 Transcript_12226/m.30986 type:complete len:210 (-) Transcript_12226:371-1000(-)